MELVPLPTPSQGKPLIQVLAASRSGRLAIVRTEDSCTELMHSHGFAHILDVSANQAAFSEDESRFVLVCNDDVGVWSSESRWRVCNWISTSVTSICFRGDSPTLLVAGWENNTIGTMDVLTREIRDVLDLEDPAADRWLWPVLSPDGSKAIFTSEGSDVLVCDLVTGTRRVVKLPRDPGLARHITSDGARAFFSYYVADLATGDVLNDHFNFTGVSPHGTRVTQRLMKGLWKQVVTVSDTLGRWMCELHMDSDSVDAFAGENELFTVDQEGTLHRFQIRPLAWGQALALFAGASGSLKRFLERDGDHAVMHKVLECLIF